MPTHRQIPGPLRRAREKANLTQELCAERLTDLAAELAAIGRITRRTSVSVRQYRRWESTDPPWPHADQRTLLEAFFRAPITELGFTPSWGECAAPIEAAPDRSDDVGLRYERSIRATVNVIGQLGRSDMERRQFLTGSLFAVAASVAPSRDWLVATLDEATSARGRVGTAQVDAIRRTFGVFQELDVMRGGGHARNQLAMYLEGQVVPLLRSNDPETETGRALYEAASEQLYLLGWMAFDNGEHVIAQRYLIQSLRLAEASMNVELGAHVLAGLSDQAILTGHPDQGVQLARTGVAGLRSGHSPACLADLRALQARGHAAMGDADAAARGIGQSQEAFASVVPEAEPEWARFIDVAYLNGEYAHAFRDLEQPTEAATFAARSADASASQNRARRGSLANAAMARAALTDHDLPAATSAALKAARLAATVQSSRSTGAVADLRIRFQEHRDSPHVKAYFEQTDALLPALL